MAPIPMVPIAGAGSSRLPSRSRWFAVGARALVLAVALVVLAGIGRFAATRASSLASAAALDAGDLRSVLPAESTASAADASAPPAPPPAMPEPAPAPAPPTAAPASPPTRATTDDPVYVNYASAEQLRRLPGVGAKRADAIVALRARMGRFQRVEDLMKVKGIGRATIRRLRPLIRLDQPEAGRP